jgi:hypothetical protein
MISGVLMLALSTRSVTHLAHNIGDPALDSFSVFPLLELGHHGNREQANRDHTEGNQYCNNKIAKHLSLSWVMGSK